MRTLAKQISFIFVLIIFSSISVFAQIDKEIKCGILTNDIFDIQPKAIVEEVQQYFRAEIDEPKLFYKAYRKQYKYFDCLSNPKPKTISYEFLEQISNNAKRNLLKQLGLAENNSEAKTISAQISLLHNDKQEAVNFADEAINLDKQNFEAHFVKSLAKMRFMPKVAESSSEALQAIEKSISLNPDFAPAYAVKSEILLNQAKRVYNNQSSESYKLILESIDKYLELAPNSTRAKFWRGQESAIEYWKKSSAGKSNKISTSKSTETNRKGLKLITKSKPPYTESARFANFQGSVLLRVWFGADGKISETLVIKSLPFGLTEQAIEAAKQIRFEPETRNRKPITVSKLIQYSFTIY